MAAIVLENKCKDSDETSACLNTLTENELVFLGENIHEIWFEKGETIIKQGTKVNSLMILLEGLVKVEIQNLNKKLILCLKPANHFIGIETLVGVEFNPYSVIALEKSKVRFIDFSITKKLMHQNSLFTDELIRVMNTNSSVVYSRMFSLTQKQLHGRLADILLCLSTKIFKSENFDLPLSRTELAELTGMAPESVIRIMKDFKDDKLIKTSGKSIQLLDIPKLEKISLKG